MELHEVEEIYRARVMEQWKPAFMAHNATPVLMLGIGHGKHSGDLVLETMAGFDDEVLIGFLSAAIIQIRRRNGREV